MFILKKYKLLSSKMLINTNKTLWCIQNTRFLNNEIYVTLDIRQAWSWNLKIDKPLPMYAPILRTKRGRCGWNHAAVNNFALALNRDVCIVAASQGSLLVQLSISSVVCLVFYLYFFMCTNLSTVTTQIHLVPKNQVSRMERSTFLLHGKRWSRIFPKESS